jgi:hypothetical protein
MSDAVAAIGATITIGGTAIEEVRDISGLEFSTDEVDVTNHDSPGFGEEVLPTIKRWGSISFPMNAVPGAAGQEALYTAWAARTTPAFVVTYTNGVTATFPGFVNSFGLSAAVTDINMVDVSIRPTEQPVLDWGS